MAIQVDNKWVKCYNICMMYKVKTQHYDMMPGSVWYDAGPCVPQPGDGPSRGVTEKEGDKTEGSLRVIPVDKLEEVK